MDCLAIIKEIQAFLFGNFGWDCKDKGAWRAGAYFKRMCRLNLSLSFTHVYLHHRSPNTGGRAISFSLGSYSPFTEFRRWARAHMIAHPRLSPFALTFNVGIRASALETLHSLFARATQTLTVTLHLFHSGPIPGTTTFMGPTATFLRARWGLAWSRWRSASSYSPRFSSQ